MSVKEVTALRKEGKLQQAYNLALSDLQTDNNKWTKMSMFWVLRDMCEYDLSQGNRDHITERLSIMADLLPEMVDDSGAGKKSYDYLCRKSLPNGNLIRQYSELSKTNATEAYNQTVEHFGKEAVHLEKELHEDFAWIILRHLKENMTELSSEQVRSLLYDYIRLGNERPSMVHSAILNFALNFSKQHQDFIFYRFLLLWGFENLRRDDFHDYDINDHHIPSLVSRIIRIFIETGQKVEWADLLHELENNPNCIDHTELMDIIRQSVFWHLMNLHKEEKWEEMWTAFTDYVHTFSTFGPSHWHSEILKLANRLMDTDNAFRFLPFMQEWDIDNLTAEDWNNEIGQDGTEYKSLAVKSAKKCFNIIKACPDKQNMSDTIDWLKTFYGKVLEKDQDEWNVRNYATIYIWRHELDEAIRIYKELLLNLSNKFYIWSELASCITDNDKLKIGLLLKAKDAERNEDFIGDIHLDLAELWATEGYYTAASKELKLYTTNRQKNSWKISERCGHISNLINEADTGTYKSPDYFSYIDEAEDFAFDQYGWTDFVLASKWTKDNIEHCTFVNAENISFSIKTKRFYHICKKAKEGDVIKFRCLIDPTNGQVTPFVAAQTQARPWSLLPLVYGVIDYDNQDKKTLHIISCNSELFFYKYMKTAYSKGDFVKFRTYRKNVSKTRWRN